MQALACTFSRWFGTGLAIVLQLIACGVWLVLGLTQEALTLFLSVEAIFITQLVLAAQARQEDRWNEMLKEVVHATPGADDRVADEDDEKPRQPVPGVYSPDQGKR